jgi:excisionase family DNA binding protein
MDEWLTLSEACAMLKLSKARVRGLMREGFLVEGVHFTRPAGMRVRYRRSAIERYLEQPERRRKPRGRLSEKVNWRTQDELQDSRAQR